MSKGNAIMAGKARINSLQAELAEANLDRSALRSALAAQRKAAQAFTDTVSKEVTIAHQALAEYRDMNDALDVINDHKRRILEQDALLDKQRVRINELKEKRAKAVCVAVSLAVALIAALGSITGGLLQ